jgi:hypothetical protein
LEQIDELLVSVAVEDQLSPVGMQSDLEHTGVIAAEPRIGEGIAVGIESCTHADTPVLQTMTISANMPAASDNRDLLSRSPIVAITAAHARPQMTATAARRESSASTIRLPAAAQHS